MLLTSQSGYLLNKRTECYVMNDKKIKSDRLQTRARSFTFAINGIWQLLRSEPNARLHLAATAGVIVAGVVQHLSAQRWVALVFAIGLYG